jgi:hypothetical protein
MNFSRLVEIFTRGVDTFAETGYPCWHTFSKMTLTSMNTPKSQHLIAIIIIVIVLVLTGGL